MQFTRTYNNTFNPQLTANAGDMAGASAMASQYSMGSRNGIQNMASLDVPVWEVNGEKFFSVIGKTTREIDLGDGGMAVYTGSDFYSQNDALDDVRVENYAEYLEVSTTV